MCLPLYIARMRFIFHVWFAFVSFVCLCVCMIVPRVIVYESALVCCKVAYHVTRV